MTSSLFEESDDDIRAITMVIISYQRDVPYQNQLIEQLSSSAINRTKLTDTIAFFDLPNCPARNSELGCTLDVEARVRDSKGQLLHAMIHVDRQRNLLALEVFPWEEWLGKLQIETIEPVRFDEGGINRPESTA